MKYFILALLLSTCPALAETNRRVDDTECTTQLDNYQLIYTYNSHQPHKIPFDELVWECKPRDIEAINAYYARQAVLFKQKMQELQ